jgi:hypothetical protein
VPLNDNTWFVFNRLQQGGLSPVAAAGLAGNLQWEGNGMNPTAIALWDNTKNSPHSVGIGQWNDRVPALAAFAQSRGIDVGDFANNYRTVGTETLQRHATSLAVSFSMFRLTSRCTNCARLKADPLAARGWDYGDLARALGTSPNIAKILAGRSRISKRMAAALAVTLTFIQNSSSTCSASEADDEPRSHCVCNCPKSGP